MLFQNLKRNFKKFDITFNLGELIHWDRDIFRSSVSVLRPTFSQFFGPGPGFSTKKSRSCRSKDRDLDRENFYKTDFSPSFPIGTEIFLGPNVWAHLLFRSRSREGLWVSYTLYTFFFIFRLSIYVVNFTRDSRSEQHLVKVEKRHYV